MKIPNLLLAPVAALALATVGQAQVGKPLPDPGLFDFAHTEAESFQDYTGRLVLLEFFAYW